MTAKEFLEHDNNIWKKIDDNNLTKAALIEFAQAYHDSEVKKLNIPAVIKSLPEYNEIIYHAKTLTDDQFREYWNEVQGNVL